MSAPANPSIDRGEHVFGKAFLVGDRRAAHDDRVGGVEVERRAAEFSGPFDHDRSRPRSPLLLEQPAGTLDRGHLAEHEHETLPRGQ